MENKYAKNCDTFISNIIQTVILCTSALLYLQHFNSMYVQDLNTGNRQKKIINNNTFSIGGLKATVRTQ